MNGADFRLIVRRGPQPNQIYELDKDVITLGRDITNDVVISDPEVSRHHSRLTRTASGYAAEDLDSTNGTFVNGQRITGAPHALNNGDLVGVGETVTLAYEAIGGSPAGQATVVGSAAPGQAPPPPPPARPAAPAARPGAPVAEQDVETPANRTLIIAAGAIVVLCCCLAAAALLFLPTDVWCQVPVGNQIPVLCNVP